MKLILLRHASRAGDAFGNPSLSATGRLQAESLAKLAASGEFPRPSKLTASPKKRALETLEPLASTLGLKIEINPNLDERTHFESGREFEGRVSRFLGELTANAKSRKGECHVYCSHQDWLESALTALPADLSASELDGVWTNAEFRVFVFNHELGIWQSDGRGTAPLNPGQGTSSAGGKFNGRKS